MAQLGHPTMEVPILYALVAPERLQSEFRSFDPVESGPLEFRALRRDDFPMFDLGVGAGRAGGTAPAIYNAANEVAVRAFLEGSLSFPGIPRAVDATLAAVSDGPVQSLEHLIEIDAEARAVAAAHIGTPSLARGETLA